MKRIYFNSVLILLFTVSNLFAQQSPSSIKGIVYDEEAPLPGASILIKNTQKGSISDFDGVFEIKNIKSGKYEVLITYIGYENKSITIDVSPNTELDLGIINLIASSENLDEVVVTALGISRKKKALGYAVSEVSGDQIKDVAQENVLNTLSGKVSGVAISSTGSAGSSVSMVIRGATSLTSDNQPLFVIDGVPIHNSLNNVSSVGSRNSVDFGNSIADLNPEDIESLTVLKGASAAALYGSRAGNGVVLITTKAGKKSKGLGVTISSSIVFEKPYKFLDTHTQYASGSRPYTEDNFPNNAYGQLLINETSSAWAGPALDQGVYAIQWPYTAAEIESGIPVARELKSYDNAKNFFQTAITWLSTISIQDTSDKMNYRLSYSKMMHEGFIPNSDLRRNSISLNSSLKLTDNFSISSTINYTKSGSDSRPAGNRGANPIQALYNTNPHIDIREMKNYWLAGYEGLRQNSPYTFGNDPTDIDNNNAYFLANEAINSFDRNHMYGNITADWKIIKDLSVRARYNYDETSEIREMRIANGYDREMNGAYGLFNLNRKESNIDFLGTYSKKFDNWDFSVSAGGNIMKQSAHNVSNSTKEKGAGLIIPGLYTVGNIAAENLNYSNYKAEKQISSLYALASIGFKGIAYLDLTYRKDWSSTLPKDFNDYDYPSISASFLLNKAFDMGNKVSLVKLRGGYAEVGNDTQAYNLYPTLQNNGAWDGATQLSESGVLLNPDLKPESQKSWEIGTDLAFFNNRLKMDYTYYEADNRDQIFPVNASPSSGYSSKLINAGLISTKGIEASLGGTIIANDNWNWDVNFVYTYNRTKIEELADGMDYLKLWGDAKGGAYTWVGEEIGNIIDRAAVRVDDPNSPYNGWLLLDDEGWENSDRTLQDEDGNRVAPVIGNFNPDFNIGMTTSITYKNWKLNMNFDWRKGGQFVSQTHRYGESDMHTQRWLDKLNNLSGIDDLPGYLKEHQDEYLLEGGQFFPLVGGPTAEAGGYEVTDGGITLNDGVFLPGVIGHYDGDGNFVVEQENLGGEGTQYHFYADQYPWSFTKASTFDADFVKLREVSLSFSLPQSWIKKTGFNNASFSVYSRNIMLWTAAGIGIDPENAFQPESSEQGSGIQFKQGIERYNANPWAIPVGFKLNVSF